MLVKCDDYVGPCFWLTLTITLQHWFNFFFEFQLFQMKQGVIISCYLNFREFARPLETFQALTSWTSAKSTCWNWHLVDTLDASSSGQSPLSSSSTLSTEPGARSPSSRMDTIYPSPRWPTRILRGSSSPRKSAKSSALQGNKSSPHTRISIYNTINQNYLLVKLQLLYERFGFLALRGLHLYYTAHCWFMITVVWLISCCKRCQTIRKKMFNQNWQRKKSINNNSNSFCWKFFMSCAYKCPCFASTIRFSRPNER